jgi:hypothetical protein
MIEHGLKRAWQNVELRVKLQRRSFPNGWAFSIRAAHRVRVIRSREQYRSAQGRARPRKSYMRSQVYNIPADALYELEINPWNSRHEGMKSGQRSWRSFPGWSVRTWHHFTAL